MSRKSRVWLVLTCAASSKRVGEVIWRVWGPFASYRQGMEERNRIYKDPAYFLTVLLEQDQARQFLTYREHNLEQAREDLQQLLTETDTEIAPRLPARPAEKRSRNQYATIDLKAPEWKDKFGDWIPVYRCWERDSGGNVIWLCRCRWCDEEEQRAVWKLIQGKTMSHRFCKARLYPELYGIPHPKARRSSI